AAGDGRAGAGWKETRTPERPDGAGELAAARKPGAARRRRARENRRRPAGAAPPGSAESELSLVTRAAWRTYVAVRTAQQRRAAGGCAPLDRVADRARCAHARACRGDRTDRRPHR